MVVLSPQGHARVEYSPHHFICARWQELPTAPTARRLGSLPARLLPVVSVRRRSALRKKMPPAPEEAEDVGAEDEEEEEHAEEEAEEEAPRLRAGLSSHCSGTRTKKWSLWRPCPLFPLHCTRACYVLAWQGESRCQGEACQVRTDEGTRLCRTRRQRFRGSPPGRAVLAHSRRGLAGSLRRSVGRLPALALSLASRFAVSS